MAKARAIVKRRRAVHNIRKITSTMQLIATARFQKCMQRALASQPYTKSITEMIQTLSRQGTGAHPLLTPNEGVGCSILLVITSNRGLCGAYNGSVMRTYQETRRTLEADGVDPTVEMVGKKGINYLKFLRIEHVPSFTDIEDKIDFSRVAELAERYMRLYTAGEIARVDVTHMQFHSVGVQRAVSAQLLPIEPPQAKEDDEDRSRVRVEFEYSPPPAELLTRLIPEAVKVRLFQFFNDAIVSEQVARMVAMKAATDAAGDMAKFLTRQYNRARQTQITTELADIVGGANAVS